MPRTCIIRVDSVQRYCDIMADQLPGKTIYHKLTDKHGKLWPGYKAFISWKYHHGGAIDPDTDRGKFLAEFYSMMLESVKPAEVFDHINRDYNNLWGSYMNFLKAKSIYQKKRIVSV